MKRDVRISQVIERTEAELRSWRTEFGIQRTSCACLECCRYCHFIPGYLIPADLGRMIPHDPQDGVLGWAERNLLASPGARVMDARTGRQFNIPTLVPAVKPDGSCINLTADDRCAIHAVAPFGCAFFGHGPAPHAGREDLSGLGLRAIQKDFALGGLYSQIWFHLDRLHLRAEAPALKRQRMNT